MKQFLISILLLFSLSANCQLWTLDHYVDDDGVEMDDSYISNSFMGTLNKEKVYIRIVVGFHPLDTIPDISFDIYKDINHLPIKIKGEATYRLNIVLTGCNTETIYLLPIGYSLYINFDNAFDKRSLLYHLSTEQIPIRSNITINGEFGSETYKFKIPIDNFNNVYKSLKNNRP